MRARPAGFLCALLVLPAWAQDQPETVKANNGSLSGLWQISVPGSIGIDFAQGAYFGPMKNIFCRIDQRGSELEAHCLNGGYGASGHGTIAGAHVHLAWGTMMARFVIDAVREGPAIRGVYAIKVAGIRHEAPQPSVGLRIHAVIADSGTDAAALVRQALEQMAQGSITIPHDDAAIARNEGGWPKGLAAKGGIMAVARLGTSPRLDHPDDGDFFTVYDVLFEKGELLCGLHRRDDGVLDGFRCV